MMVPPTSRRSTRFRVRRSTERAFRILAGGTSENPVRRSRYCLAPAGSAQLCLDHLCPHLDVAVHAAKQLPGDQGRVDTRKRRPKWVYSQSRTARGRVRPYIPWFNDPYGSRPLLIFSIDSRDQTRRLYQSASGRVVFAAPPTVSAPLTQSASRQPLLEMKSSLVRGS